MIPRIIGVIVLLMLLVPNIIWGVRAKPALDDRLLLIQERMENEMKGMTVADVSADVKKEIDAEQLNT